MFQVEGKVVWPRPYSQPKRPTWNVPYRTGIANHYPFQKRVVYGKQKLVAHFLLGTTANCRKRRSLDRRFLQFAVVPVFEVGQRLSTHRADTRRVTRFQAMKIVPHCEPGSQAALLKNAKAPTFRPGPCAAEAEPSGLIPVLYQFFSHRAQEFCRAFRQPLAGHQRAEAD